MSHGEFLSHTTQLNSSETSGNGEWSLRQMEINEKPKSVGHHPTMFYYLNLLTHDGSVNVCQKNYGKCHLPSRNSHLPVSASIYHTYGSVLWVIDFFQPKKMIDIFSKLAPWVLLGFSSIPSQPRPDGPDSPMGRTWPDMAGDWNPPEVQRCSDLQLSRPNGRVFLYEFAIKS